MNDDKKAPKPENLDASETDNRADDPEWEDDNFWEDKK